MTISKLIELYDAGKYKTVYSHCRKQLEWNPDDLYALFYAALVQSHFRMYDVALENYKRILKINPTEQHVHCNIGEIYLQQKNDTLAIFNYKREIRLYPKSYQANYNLGIIYFVKKQYIKAVPYLENCLNFVQGDEKIAIANMLAQIYFERKQYAKAIPFLLKHVKKNKNEECIYMAELLAQIYHQQQDIYKELAVYHLLIRRHPSNPMMWNNAAACYIDLKQYQKALKLLQKALSLAGNRRGYGCVRRNIKKIQIIQTKYNGGGGNG